MAISVKLEAFEGPLDLLLHLIEKNNCFDSCSRYDFSSCVLRKK